MQELIPLTNSSLKLLELTIIFRTTLNITSVLDGLRFPPFTLVSEETYNNGSKRSISLHKQHNIHLQAHI